VRREIPKTDNVERAAGLALEELIKGPTDEERKRGYHSCIPAGGQIARLGEAYSRALSGNNEEGRAMDEWWERFRSSDGTFSPWGDKVTVIGVQIKEGTAYADFSKELYSYGGGSCYVRAIETSIMNTVKQFPEVQKVEILIEGRKAEIEP
jgi:spore germination protein GerM